jgi:hypothetical protein
MCIWKDLQPHLDCTGTKLNQLSLRSEVFIHVDRETQAKNTGNPAQQSPVFSPIEPHLNTSDTMSSKEKGKRQSSTGLSTVEFVPVPWGSHLSG